MINGIARTLARLVTHALAPGHEIAVLIPGLDGAGAENVALHI